MSSYKDLFNSCGLGDSHADYYLYYSARVGFDDNLDLVVQLNSECDGGDEFDYTDFYRVDSRQAHHLAQDIGCSLRYLPYWLGERFGGVWDTHTPSEVKSCVTNLLGFLEQKGVRYRHTRKDNKR